MNTSKFFASLLVFVAMMLAVGCQPESVDKPDVPDEQPCFTFEILDVDKTAVSFRVTPLAEEMPYVIMIVDKASFDAFESEEEYIADDLAWFDQIALSMGISLEDYLATILTTGVKEDSAEGLSPDTEYYLYAYHLTAEGEVVSDLEYKEFKTAALDKSDATFEVSVSDIGYNEATINVIPSSSTATYFVNIISVERMADFGEGAEAYVNHLVALRDYYLGMGATTEQMIANLCFAGAKSLTIDDLTSGIKHYAYAIGVDDDFLPNTEAFVVEFDTLAAESSELTFEVNITATDYDHVEGMVTPSNDNEAYVCSIQTAESLTWYASDEEFMQVLLDDLEWWYGGVETALHTGVTDLSTYGGLYPETEYVVVCFGYDGAPTTELFTSPFTTTEASGNPEDLVVEFDIDYERLSHNTVYVTAKPSEGVYYFLSYISTFDLECYVDEYGTEDAALVAYANEEIDYGADFNFDVSDEFYTVEAKRLKGTYMLLDEASVTGTANIVMAAVLAEGRTTIYNAACEPYLQQLCKMLNRMGAKISGIASNLLVIDGVESLGGTEHTMLPDMIEVGSFIGMAAMTRSELTIKNVSYENLGIIPQQFARMGIRFEQRGDDIFIPAQENYSIESFIDGSIMTIADAPWPGLTPDLLSIFLVVATQAKGAVLIHQKMFESRLFFVDKLIDMGAQIILCDPHRATVIGHNHEHALRAANMTSPDIRAGVALLIAAMSAEGTSTIQNIEQIDRGYRDIDKRLNALGARITRLDE